MAVDREWVLKRLQRIEDNQRVEIGSDVPAFSPGHVVYVENGESVLMGLERLIKAGVERAGEQLMAEARSIASQDAPTLADEVGACVSRLGELAIRDYRQKLSRITIVEPNGRSDMAQRIDRSCERLAKDLSGVQELKT
jgi:hypothetical protein